MACQYGYFTFSNIGSNDSSSKFKVSKNGGFRNNYIVEQNVHDAILPLFACGFMVLQH